MICGRYGPSPTGPLHLGNLLTALVAWLQVRLQGGTLVLRIDDLDVPRNKPGATQQIINDLQWLGLNFDAEPIFQSERGILYQQVFKQLQATGQVFPCRCSRKDITQAVSAPHINAAGKAYPGTCRPDTNPVDPDEQEVLAWRFLVDDGEIVVEDQIYQMQTSCLRDYPGDFVVKRKDGIFAYQLASVVDDIAVGVTDVVRGQDLMDSTARQLVLFEAVGATAPRFWHVPLMTDQAGNKLSKRDGAVSLAEYQAKGFRAEDVVGVLAASIGLIEPGQSISSNELLQQINLGQLVRSLKHAIKLDRATKSN